MAIKPLLPPRPLHSIAPQPRSSSSASPSFHGKSSLSFPRLVRPLLPSSSAAGARDEVVLVTGGPVSRASSHWVRAGEVLQVPNHQQPASRSLASCCCSDGPRPHRHQARGLRLQFSRAAPPPPMGTPGSRARAIGFIIMLISVSAGIHSGNRGFAVLLGFTGVLAGANLVAVGVRTADGPAPAVPAVSEGARAVAAFLRRHVAIIGLVMASSAFVTPVSGDAGPVLCVVMFALLVLGLTLINLGVRGE